MAAPKRVYIAAPYTKGDVALERDVVAFLDRHGYVVNGKTGGVLKVPRLAPGSLR